MSHPDTPETRKANPTMPSYHYLPMDVTVYGGYILCAIGSLYLGVLRIRRNRKENQS